MRVLVVTSLYPPHHRGGYELLCRDAVRRWVADGHQVRVLTTNHSVGDETLADDDDVRVVRELTWYWDDGEFLRPSPLRRFDLERRNQRRLRQTLQIWRPDVISIWHMGGMSLGLLTTLAGGLPPLVYVVSDEWLGYGPKVDPWTSAWKAHPRVGAALAAITRVPTSSPDFADSGTFCFLSDWLRKRSELAIGGAFERCHIVPPGIDPVDFPIVDPVGDRPWRGQLLCAGRVEPRKGFQTAIKALPELETESLVIDGPTEGGYADELRDLAVSLGVGDRVSHVVSPRADLAARYAAADALLFTSIWEEPFGLVPIEAMACGTPVVATGTGGSAEYLRHEENCLLVPPGDAAALAAAVRRLASEDSLRSRLRAGGVRTANRYSVDRYAGTLESIHRESIRLGAVA